MKMIAQLAKALQQILRLKDSGRDDDAMREIDGAMQRIVGLNSALVNALSEESLASALKGGIAIDHGKALVLAELLTQEGDVLDARGREDESLARYYRALYLYLEVFAGDDEFRLPNYDEKIDAVVAKVEDLVLPVPVSLRLVRYYEEDGRFAEAEDAVDAMLEEHDSDEARAGARALYERLSERSDEELLAGDFTRAEVVEGISRLGE